MVPTGRPHPAGPSARRTLLFIAAAVVALDTAVGFVIRATLSVSSHGVGWILKPVAFYGRTEHSVGHFSSGTVVPIIVTLSVLLIAPVLRVIRGVLTGAAVGMAGGLSNALETLIRGSATDYIALRHIPTASQGTYNLADLEISVGFAIVSVALVLFLVRQLFSRVRSRTTG